MTSRDELLELAGKVWAMPPLREARAGRLRPQPAAPSSRSAIPIARSEQARALLEHHKAKLEAVIAADHFVCNTNAARGMLARVKSWLKQPPLAMELALGEMGPNKYGALIDAICRDSEHHRRLNERMGRVG